MTKVIAALCGLMFAVLPMTVAAAVVPIGAYCDDSSSSTTTIDQTETFTRSYVGLCSENSDFGLGFQVRTPGTLDFRLGATDESGEFSGDYVKSRIQVSTSALFMLAKDTFKSVIGESWKYDVTGVGATSFQLVVFESPTAYQQLENGQVTLSFLLDDGDVVVSDDDDDNLSAVPLPAAGLMILTGLGAFGLCRRRRPSP